MTMSPSNKSSKSQVEENLSITVEVATRHYFASEHLRTAFYGVSLSRDLEARLTGGGEPVNPEHRSAVVTTVMSSVAFLEALVNEVYADASDAHHDSARIAALSPAVRTAMQQYIATTNPRPKTLAKYDRVIMAAGAEPLDHGQAPYQDAGTLIRLRNALTHFKPEWHNAGSPNPLELELKGKFGKSALLSPGDGSPWPIWAVSAGCAEWAYKTARALADEWTARLGLLRVYETDMKSWGLA